MSYDISGGVTEMGTAQKSESHDYNIFDDAEALFKLAQQSFNRAAKSEVAKNDALGIQTHGAINGRLVVRTPSQNAYHVRQP